RLFPSDIYRWGKRVGERVFCCSASTLSKKPTPSLISSQPAWELEGSNGSKMAGKHRSSVQDDLGSGGPMRRIWQKADCYAFVPTESTQMASKILEHLERTIPKEKPSSSRLARTTKKSATKWTKNSIAARDFEVSDHDNHSTAPPVVQGNTPTTNAASTLALPAEPPQKKQISAHEVRVMFCSFALSYPPLCFVKDFEVSDDDNHSTTPPVQGNAPTTNVASTLALPAKPPQKKHAFHMSIHKVFEVLDDDNHSTAPVQGNASTTNVVSTWSLPGYDDPTKKILRLRL
ncbi:hypothetical protein Tco_1373390, partial [Tanacetum coccineum]